MRCCPFADGNGAGQNDTSVSPGRLPFVTNHALPPFLTPSRNPSSPFGQHAYSLHAATPPRFTLQKNERFFPPANVPMLDLPSQASMLPMQFYPIHPGMNLGTTPYYPFIAPLINPFPWSFPTPNIMNMPMPASLSEKFIGNKVAEEVNRPLTPSPTGSDSSGTSFAFSSVGIASPGAMSALASPSTPYGAEVLNCQRGSPGRDE